jgi:protein-tyrosine phosphatase
MIDLHCHILPGIDDGPDTMAESVELARGEVAAGISVVVATPHVNRRFPNDVETILRLTGELRARLAQEDVALTVLPGAEIAITQLADIEPSSLSRLGLGGGRSLLVEPPFLPVATGIDIALMALLQRGVGVVIAHPERCPAFQGDPVLLRRLVSAGALTSITASSLVGRFGENVRRFALQLAREGIIHNVASDAHDCVRRPPGIAGELEQAGLAPLEGWLTSSVPAAIFADRHIPPRPARPPRVATPQRKLWQRLRGGAA